MQQYLFFQTFLYLVQESVIDLEWNKMKKNIMMACGHYQEVELPDGDENRAKIQQQKVETLICRACYVDRINTQQIERYDAIMEDRQYHGYEASYLTLAECKYILPELDGSAKQVRWAESIRAKFIRGFSKLRKKIGNHDEEETILQWVVNHNLTGWWISFMQPSGKSYNENDYINNIYHCHDVTQEIQKILAPLEILAQLRDS